MSISPNVPTTAQIPLCRCGGFLIYNFYFVGKRFLCLGCGELYANPPRSQPSSRESEAKLAALESEFLLNCGSKLFCFGMNRFDCDRCNGPDEEEHIRHATDRDWVRLNDGLKWLSDRTGKEFGMVNGELGHATELLSVARSVTRPLEF